MRLIFAKDFKNRCFAAIEHGDFVPIESFMCSTGEKDLCDNILTEALVDCRMSRPWETATRMLIQIRPFTHCAYSG